MTVGQLIKNLSEFDLELDVYRADKEYGKLPVYGAYEEKLISCCKEKKETRVVVIGAST